MSSRAMENRSLRTIRNELEFLLDSSVISQSAYNTILNNLPSSPSGGGAALPTPTPSPMPTVTPSPAPIPTPTHQDEKAAQAFSSTPSTMGPPPPAYGAATTGGPPPLATVVGLYEYKATEAGDLAFTAGERIAVTEYTNAEWWKGRSERSGAEGIFPRNYVKIVEDGKKDGYGNVPLEVSEGSGSGREHGIGGIGGGGGGGKVNEQGKKFGKKLGNAAIFGAGATIGGKIVNGIF